MSRSSPCYDFAARACAALGSAMLASACSVYEGGDAFGSEDGTASPSDESASATFDPDDGGVSFDAGASTGPSGDSPDFAEIGIRPPDVLELDGQSVAAGELRVRTVQVAGSDLSWTVLVDAADPPIVKQANIGAGEYHPLFMVPGDTQVMQVAGEFDAQVPDLPPAQFRMIVVGAVSQPSDLTVYLPSMTSQSCAQISGLGPGVTEADNVDVFCSADPPSVESVIADAATGMLALDQAPLSTCTCGVSGVTGGTSFFMTSHGTVSSNGGCGFTCGDDTCVSASAACNGLMDCPGGQDEDPATCSDARSCCIATMGCPSESGSECGEMCCCCPGGQACCPNPNDGCCAA